MGMKVSGKCEATISRNLPERDEVFGVLGHNAWIFHFLLHRALFPVSRTLNLGAGLGEIKSCTSNMLKTLHTCNGNEIMKALFLVSAYHKPTQPHIASVPLHLPWAARVYGLTLDLLMCWQGQYQHVSELVFDMPNKVTYPIFHSV